MENNENKKTGIVLNRMYTGSYLSTNLGHEVINMFQADNGKHYLYLNAKGNFDKERGISDMLLVRYVGENKVEILAWASQLTPAPGANMSYTKYDVNSDIFQKQQKIINKKEDKIILPVDEKEFENWSDEINKDHEITYGGVNLIDIFGEDDQQNIYITYRAEEFRTPSKRLFLEFVDETEFYYPTSRENTDDTFYFNGYLLGKTTLHQYICGDEYDINGNTWNSLIVFLKEKFNNKKEITDTTDLKSVKEKIEKKLASNNSIKKIDLDKYKKLQSLLSSTVLSGCCFKNIKNEIQKEINCRRKQDLESLYTWLLANTAFVKESKKIAKIDLDNFLPRQVSLFDIMPKLQRDENCFSDALMYFMDRDKDEWQNILKKLCNDDNIGAICSIKREKDATISSKKKDKERNSEEGNNGNEVLKKKKGGRIDLLIRTEMAYVVIENKIKSGINSKEDDQEGNDQLDRYRNYVNYRIIGDFISQLNDEDATKKKLQQEYDKIAVEDFYKQKDQMEKDIRDVYKKEGKELPNIKAYFFVLAPDYNMPNEDERKGYIPLYYSALVGVENATKNKKEVVDLMKEYHNSHEKENLWSAFYDAMKRHSYDYENDSLYEDMKNTFFSRINKLNSKKSDNHD